ncbi:hypothetical protein MtrunA17_Chr4g0021971 [Medicago truncatula]|uniref:Uncharacterized protein n=1 Tax=Medicago truncatula TaxID=3880 RepID=A0A396I3A4_MEDTR|nr:hypothetical protein MtrunA17_Chr4g0021971 [Medicago truncatula]
MALNNFVLYEFWGMKFYFCILGNLYVGQKVVLWFGEGQKYQFLSCPLPPVFPIPETVLQIKYWTTGVVLSSPYFLAYQTHPKRGE